MSFTITANVGVGIENSNATTDVPSNYLICDLTGFRVSVDEGLHKTWDGLMVRRESYYSRHPQDFVRGRSDDQRGSPRPEQDDRFISDLYPNGVSASDL